MSGLAFRKATITDIPAMHVIRLSVRENALSNPLFVTEKDYVDMLEHPGQGWVCSIEGKIAGFAIVDIAGKNIWALFVAPEFEKLGVGRGLHDRMLDWSFDQPGTDQLWLGTAPSTRAELFYRKAGWRDNGVTSHGEIRFEMDGNTWRKHA